MEKYYFIDNVALKRLVDPAAEIRVRSLRELTAILKNNILFVNCDSKGGNEELSVVSLDILVRHLIRWFQFRPVLHEGEVLDLLVLILSRRDFLRNVAKHISVSRLKKEIVKIKKLMLSDESSVKLQTINQLLSDYESSILIDCANVTGSFSDVDSPQYSHMSHLQENPLIERTRRVQNASPTPSVSSKCDDNEVFIEEEFWEKLEGVNLDTFNGIDAELSLYGETRHLCNVLNFLRTSADDYPAEFFLQPPNILESLVDILYKVANEHSRQIVKLIRFIINGLKGRCLESLKSARKQEQNLVSIKKHINNILTMLTNYFERFHDSFNPAFFKENQNVLNEVYLLLFDIAEFIVQTQNACEIYLNELMNMMGKVAKDLRLFYVTADDDHKRMIRLHYMVCIYIINALISSIDTSNISAYYNNNIWEFECDVALLDIPLKVAHSGIYSLIMRNRKEVIKADEDLTLLLNCQKSWKSVVEIFQDWEKMSDEAIVFKGLEAIDTIRIHKSLDLVNLLMVAIQNCSISFGNQDLKEAAEEIFLRLLSIDVPDVRRRVYAIASKSIQKQMEDGFGDQIDASLCSIIGIPVTTEVVTEILCFGFTDSDGEIMRNARKILFALLRSKVIFKNHWQQILNVMKPILPLMTCMISINEKMGFFTFDVYHQHSGFDDAELNEAFARFLYCNHPRARIMAKTKLLQNLQLDEELIEVVPNDFCHIPTQKATDLPITNATLGYDEDAYKTTHEVLKTMNRSDGDLVQSVLLQLSILMNSKALCQKSHDDNVWVYFMAPLDMGFPESKIIRKLSVDILLKWTLVIPTFRGYLAHEPKVLKFLVKTLIFFQDDDHIKKQSSSLMFLLLFNDFIVTTEKIISMPQLLSTLGCPFKSEYHWTESPFNKITHLEQLFEVLESNQEAADIREVSHKFLKFSFALEWFKTERKFVEMRNFTSDSFYQNLSPKTLKIGEKLELTESDFTCVKQSVSKQILASLCRQLDNSTMVSHAQELVYEAQVLLMIPVVYEEGFAELVDKRIERFTVYSAVNPQQKMFTSFLQIYQQIMKNLKDERIVNVFNKRFISSILMSNISISEEAYVEGLNVINCVVKLCMHRSTMMDLLIKTFEREHKVFLPSRIVEKLMDHLFNEIMKDGKWHEAGKRPIVKSILIIVRNVLNIMPIHLDDAYLNVLYDKLVMILLPIYRSHFNHIRASTPLHIHSSMIKIIFAILLKIASTVKQLNLKPEHFKSLNFWSFNDMKKNKSLSLLIIAELTKKKEGYDSFVKGYHEMNGTMLFDVVAGSLLRPIQNINGSMLDQKALVVVMANILDHDYFCANVLNCITLTIEKLLECGNLSAVAFIIRKMVQIDFPNTVEIVIEREIVRKFLSCPITNTEPKAYQLIAELFETIIVCFKHKPLKEHVSEIVINESNPKFMKMFIDSKGLNNAVFKRFNNDAFNMLLILMNSEVGLMKICQALDQPRIIDRMMFASHDNMRITNPHNELMFQLGFWNSLLSTSDKFNSPVIDLISTHMVDVASGAFVFMNPPEADEKFKQSFGTILEKKFSCVSFAIDLLFLQVVSIFDFVYSSKFSAEYKHDLKALCFLIIRKLMATNERVKQLSIEIDLISILTDKLDLTLTIMQASRHLETTKKNGVQKCQFIIKDLCIFLNALTEWQLPLNNHTKLIKDLFTKLLKVSDWLDADSVLMNSFMNLLQVVSKMNIGRSCAMEEVEGKPLMINILKKTQSFSVKPPHTETNLALMRNGLSTLKAYSKFVEVRVMLKNSKVFQTLEVLHPQIQKNRKTTWDEVTVEWLKFFESLSRFDDTECLPNQVSLLCRLFRLGNQTIKKQSLVIIRNLSLRSSIGHVLLNSEDFKQTVDLILMGSGETREKILILQTLLSIASKAEQLKAKLKNSSLNRKLKDQLMMMKSDAKFQSNPENDKILNLTTMLSQMLYPKD